MTAEAIVSGVDDKAAFGHAVPPRRNGLIPFVTVSAFMIGRRASLLLVASVVAGFLLGFIEVAFGAALVAVLSHYNLTPNTLPASLMKLVALAPPVPSLIVLALLIFVIRGAVSSIPGIVTEAVQARVRRAVAAASLSYDSEETRLSVAETAHLFADVLPKSAGFMSSFTLGATSLITALTIIVGVLNLSTAMTLIAIGVSALMLLPLVAARRFDRRLGQAFFTATGTFSVRIMKAIRNAMLLKISGTAHNELDVLVDASRSSEHLYLKYIMIQSIQSGLPLLAGVLVMIALLEVNAREQLFSILELVPFVYLLSRLAGACSSVITSLSGMRYTMAFFKRFVGLRDEIFHEAAAPRPGQRVPALRRVQVESLRIGRDHVIASGISFALETGGMLLISGPSGRGKTTLLMTLVGLVPAHAGRILWNGIDIDALDLGDLRDRVGYAGADPYLLDASVEDNLLFGKSRSALTEDDYRKALACARAEFVYALEGGLSHQLREGGEGISAGQKQRIAIARALLRKPDVLILDEATGNVDIENEAAIIRSIRREYPGLMIIAVSHRGTLEQFADAMLRL